MRNLDQVDVFSKIGRSKPIRPSKLSVLSVCPWQYLLSTEQNCSPVLEVNPIGVLGSAMHKIIEKYAGQHTLKGLEVQQMIANEFEKKISLQPDNLLKRTFIRLGVNGVINPQRLLSASRLAFKSIRTAPQKKLGIELSFQNFETHSSDFIRERKLSSTELELEGWPDLVYKNENAIHVVDYKLSLRKNEDGKPKESYILQAAAYGLLAKECYKNSNVVLELISPTDKWVSPLDSELEIYVRTKLKQASNALPFGEVFDASQIARTGLHCVECSYRPGCMAYNANFLEGQQKSSETICSNDVFGQILAIKEADGFLSLEVESTFEKRKVVVEGVLKYSNSNPSIGSNFVGYGLGTTEIKGRGKYVANFHIFNPTNPTNSAFSSYAKTYDAHHL